MTTATTTLAAIRGQMEDTVRGLTPSSFSGYPFVLHVPQQDFQAWAIDNTQSAFRAYQVRDVSVHEEPEVTDEQIEHRTGTFDVMVAYPHEFGRIGADNFRSLDDLIEKDREQLLTNLGRRGHANYPAGVHDALATAETADEDVVSFLVMSIEIQYDRDVS